MWIRRFAVIGSISAGLMASPPRAAMAQEVRVPVVDGELAGTLDMPTDGARALVILVTGGGTSTRDYETPWQFEPFRVLAAHFAREAIATVRFDDRGAGATSAPETADPESLVTDLSAVAAWISTRDDLVDLPLFVLGHSLGGMTATAAAARWPALDGLILLNSPAMPGAAALMAQRRQLLHQQGIRDEQLTDHLELFEATLQAVLGNGSWERVEAASRKVQGEEPTEEFLAQHRTPQFAWMARFDPENLLAGFDGDVLYVFGERDALVAPADHQQPATALTAGRRGSSVLVVSEMNHFMQVSATYGPPGWAEGGEAFAPNLLARLVDWILSGVDRNG